MGACCTNEARDRKLDAKEERLGPAVEERAPERAVEERAEKKAPVPPTPNTASAPVAPVALAAPRQTSPADEEADFKIRASKLRSSNDKVNVISEAQCG